MIIGKLGQMLGGSNDANFAVSSATSPNLQLFRESGSVFTAAPAADTAISSTSLSLKWAPSKNYLGVGSQSTPYIYFFKKVGPAYRKVTNPATLPAGALQGGIAWAPGSDYVCVAGLAGGGVSGLAIYSRSGDTFTKETGPTISGGGTNTSFGGCSWSPGGRLAVTPQLGTSNSLQAWSVSGTTFTPLSFDTVAAASYLSCAWSPNDDYLAVSGVSSSPYLYLYSRSGTSLTRLSNPASLPSAQTRQVAWSPDSSHVAFSHLTGPPYLTVYSRSGSTFTKLSDAATQPSGGCRGVCWSPDSTSIAIGTESTYGTYVYDLSGGTLTLRSGMPFGPAQSYFIDWIDL